MKVKSKDASKIGDKDIKAFEKQFNIKLPLTYCSIIKENNGATLDSNIANIADSNKPSLRSFIKLNEIQKVKSGFEKLPENFLPFGDDDCGNYFLIELNKEGSVYFWDHESHDPIKKISKSFISFIESIEPFDFDECEATEAEKNSGWIDPEFKKLMIAQGLMKPDNPTPLKE